MNTFSLSTDVLQNLIETALKENDEALLKAAESELEARAEEEEGWFALSA